MTDLDNARETWNFEREHWNGPGPSIRYDKATLALITALEAELADVREQLTNLAAALDLSRTGRDSADDQVEELRTALAKAEAALKEMKPRRDELEALIYDHGTISNENRKLRAAIVEWEEMWDEVESMDPEELTDDNLNQISEWYMRYLAACDRLRAIAKGSAL